MIMKAGGRFCEKHSKCADQSSDYTVFVIVFGPVDWMVPQIQEFFVSKSVIFV